MKIMIVILRTMGDVVLGTTLCRELKRDFPDSEIHFYVNHQYSEILENNPYVDRIHDSHDWNYDQIFLEMVRGGYDKIFAPYQVRGECNAWHQFEDTRHQHLLDFYWKRMGVHRPIEERECYIFPKEKDFLAVGGFFPDKPPINYIALHSTSGVKTKDWPYFDQLVEDLKSRIPPDWVIVQVGARSDTMIEGAIDLRGRFSIAEFGAFVSRCGVFVGLDSGLSYISDAMKTPTIVIQGSTDPVTSGPISDRVIHLFSQDTGYDDCQIVRCHGNCRHEINCNTKITVSMVTGKIKEVIENAGIKSREQ